MRTLTTIALLGVVAMAALGFATPAASAVDCAILIDPVTHEPMNTCDPLGVCQTSLGDKLTWCQLT